MQHLGMREVKNVRIGKYLEIDLERDGADVEARLPQTLSRFAFESGD